MFASVKCLMRLLTDRWTSKKKRFLIENSIFLCRAPELYAFVAGEIARHCKRPASPLDVNMDVQSLKRQRFM